MPTLVAAKQHEREAAEREHAKHHSIRRREGRFGADERQQQKGRRENQRLRIGDLRRASKDIGRPEWAFAIVQRMSEKLQLRKRLGFGVPGNCHRAG